MWLKKSSICRSPMGQKYGHAPSSPTSVNMSSSVSGCRYSQVSRSFERNTKSAAMRWPPGPSVSVPPERE